MTHPTLVIAARRGRRRPDWIQRPATALDAIYRRLWQILSGQVAAKPYARLSASDRAAVADIL